MHSINMVVAIINSVTNCFGDCTDLLKDWLLWRLWNYKTWYRFGWGAPGPSSSATHGRRLRTPVASYCGGLFPSRNKFNIV